MNFLTFDFLKSDGVFHAFTLRQKEGMTLGALEKIGFPKNSFVLAEQIHSNEVACVTKEHCGKTIQGADSLITQERGVTLVIRTADCCPVFILDPVQQAIGLVHSGKKGTQLDILGKTVEKMVSCFESKPSDLRVALGPCIRPPHYEVDIPTEIKKQAQKAGIVSLYDCELDTAADWKKFYSYRMEKGKTGRHYSALMLV